MKLRTNMISLLMDIILELAQEVCPDVERVSMVVDIDGYRSIAGFTRNASDPDDVEIGFRAYTFGEGWRVDGEETEHAADS